MHEEVVEQERAYQVIKAQGGDASAGSQFYGNIPPPQQVTPPGYGLYSALNPRSRAEGTCTTYFYQERRSH